MTRRPELPAAAVALLAALGLTACGSGTAVQPTTTTTTTTPGRSVVYTFGAAQTRRTFFRTEHVTPTPIPGIEGTVIQIATSNSTTYALTSSGTVWAWGVGSSGQLGNGSFPDSVSTAVEVDFPAGVDVTSLPNPMPYNGALAIDSRGDAWGWGYNDAHDLCLPDRRLVSRPAMIPLSGVTLATGALTHSLFDSDGAIYACGQNEYGVLGNGGTRSNATPEPVVGLPRGTFKMLTSSWGGSGALMADGSYYNWGYNRDGQLGNGTTANSPLPVHVTLPGSVVQVFQGGNDPNNGQTLAILADNSLWTWGNGKWGQLGNGRRRSSTVPIQIALPGGAVAASVASGGYASYAIDTSGHLWAWGRNNLGQLGKGSNVPFELTPASVGLSLQQISATAQNVAGLST